MPQTQSTTLFAVTGMSPAVLTETVWALVHGTPAVIPDRVVVITTAAGRAQIIRELLEPSAAFDGRTVWHALRSALESAGHNLTGKLAFGSTPDDIRVFTGSAEGTGERRELDDIRTPADNAIAADFLLDHLRQFTENPDTRIVASIAGGRKTMSALLYAGMSLLGRPQDRLLHVLVNAPFDSAALAPRFYFPCQPPAIHHLHDRSGAVVSTHRSSEADFALAEVPFVRLRKLFPEALGRYPGRFGDLVQLYSQQVDSMHSGLAPADSNPPAVSLRSASLAIDVRHFAGESQSIRLTERQFAWFAFLYDRCLAGHPPFQSAKDSFDAFRVWFPEWAQTQNRVPRLAHLPLDWKVESLDDETLFLDFRKLRNGVKNRLTKAGIGDLCAFLLPQRGRYAISVSSPQS